MGQADRAFVKNFSRRPHGLLLHRSPRRCALLRGARWNTQGGRVALVEKGTRGTGDGKRKVCLGSATRCSSCVSAGVAGCACHDGDWLRTPPERRFRSFCLAACACTRAGGSATHSFFCRLFTMHLAQALVEVLLAPGDCRMSMKATNNGGIFTCDFV